MTDQTNLDRLIDDVARGITAHEPRLHFRTRVLARLEERRSPRRAWLLIPIVVSAAAVLVTIAVITHDHPAQPAGTTLVAPPTEIARATPERVAIVDAADGPQTGSGAIGAAAHREVSSKEAAAWREELMPSLPAIAALGIAEIQPESLTIPQLTVKPLVVAPIDDGNNQR